MASKRALVKSFTDAENTADKPAKPTRATAKDLEIFATIPWLLAPDQEVMIVHERQMEPEQVEAILRVLKSDDMKVRRATDDILRSFSKERTTISEAIPDPSKYASEGNREFRFYPPVAFAPVWRGAWDRALPDAEERMNSVFQRLEGLPWQRTQTSDARYYLLAKDLSEDQKRLVDVCSQHGFLKKSRFSLLHKGEYELDNEARGYIDHRFYQHIHTAMEAAYEQDAAAVGKLPWIMTREGDLVVYQNDIANLLTGGEGGAALSLAMSRRKIESKDGFFILRSVNTVGKIYEAPDGEVDHGRIYCFDEAMKGVRERLKVTVDQMLALPWIHNPKKLRFEINPAIITSGGIDPVRDLPENALLRDGTTWFLPEVPLIHRPTGEIQDIISGFLKALSRKFENTDLKGAENLPWKRGVIGLNITPAELKAAGLKNLHIPHGKDYDGNMYIPEDSGKKLAYMPYRAAIRAAVSRNQQAFIDSNAEQIRSLPWQTGIADNVDGFNAMRLHPGDLDPAQQVLVKEMAERDMLENVIKDFRLKQGPLTGFLKPVFEACLEKTMAAIAAMPWEYNQGGIRFCVDQDRLTPDQLKLMESLRQGVERHGAQYSLKASRESESYYGSGFAAKNRLVQAVAHAETRNALVPVLPPEILSLSWRYDSRFSDSRISVSKDDLRPQDEAALQTAGFHKCLSSYDVHGDTSSYLGLAILDGGVYGQLARVADANLTADLKAARKFPWKDIPDGDRGVRFSDLTMEQQAVVKNLPRDYWSRSFTKFSSDVIYTPSRDIPDQRLVFCATGAKPALPPAPGL